jgi:hypothetical protein
LLSFVNGGRLFQPEVVRQSVVEWMILVAGRIGETKRIKE